MRSMEESITTIERDNEEVKERYGVMRGFKNLMAAKAILDLHWVVQNYVHATKGRKKGKNPS
jgi:hypothetical protein